MSAHTLRLQRELEESIAADEKHAQEVRSPAARVKVFLEQNRLNQVAEVAEKDGQIVVSFTGVGGEKDTRDTAELHALRFQIELGKKGVAFTSDQASGITTLTRQVERQVLGWHDPIGNLPPEPDRMEWFPEQYGAYTNTHTVSFAGSEVAAKIEPGLPAVRDGLSR